MRVVFIPDRKPEEAWSARLHVLEHMRASSVTGAAVCRERQTIEAVVNKTLVEGHELREGTLIRLYR